MWLLAVFFTAMPTSPQGPLPQPASNHDLDALIQTIVHIVRLHDCSGGESPMEWTVKKLGVSLLPRCLDEREGG